MSAPTEPIHYPFEGAQWTSFACCGTRLDRNVQLTKDWANVTCDGCLKYRPEEET